LQLQLDDDASTDLAAPFSTRIPAVRGRHVLRIFRAGAKTPDAIAQFVVNG